MTKVEFWCLAAEKMWQMTSCKSEYMFGWYKVEELALIGWCPAFAYWLYNRIYYILYKSIEADVPPFEHFFDVLSCMLVVFYS